MEKEKSIAEKKLMDVCAKANIRQVDLFALVNQVYDGDKHFQEKIQANRQNGINNLQLDLMELQVLNETMKNQILSVKRNRIMWRIGVYAKIKRFFKKLNIFSGRNVAPKKSNHEANNE